MFNLTAQSFLSYIFPLIIFTQTDHTYFGSLGECSGNSQCHDGIGEKNAKAQGPFTRGKRREKAQKVSPSRPLFFKLKRAHTRAFSERRLM